MAYSERRIKVTKRIIVESGRSYTLVHTQVEVRNKDEELLFILRLPTMFEAEIFMEDISNGTNNETE